MYCTYFWLKDSICFKHVVFPPPWSQPWEDDPQMTFISFAEWLNRQLFMTTMNKSPNYRNYIQLSPLQMGHSHNHACSPVASHSPHIIWTCLLGQPPWLLVTCFAGEHDHHKMGCISHQEQWVITFILMLLHLLVTLYKLGQSWYHPVIKRGNWNTQDSFSHCNTHLVRGFSIAMFD